MRGAAEQQEVWVTRDQLRGQERVLQAFVRRLRE